jgi:hypothetical protein
MAIKYFAPTELLLENGEHEHEHEHEHERRTLPRPRDRTPNVTPPCTMQNEFYLPCSLHDGKTLSIRN